MPKAAQPPAPTTAAPARSKSTLPSQAAVQRAGKVRAGAAAVVPSAPKRVKQAPITTADEALQRLSNRRLRAMALSECVVSWKAAALVSLRRRLAQKIAQVIDTAMTHAEEARRITVDAGDVAEAAKLVCGMNIYAPETLTLNSSHQRRVLKFIDQAGRKKHKEGASEEAAVAAAAPAVPHKAQKKPRGSSIAA